MFSNNGNYEKDIVQFTDIPYEVSYTGENIVAVTFCFGHQIVFVNVITNTITNTIYIGHTCYGTDFHMNRLAMRVIQPLTSSHIVYLDPKGKLIDRVNIPGENSPKIALRDDTITCTNWLTNAIHCYTLTGEEIWTFKDEKVLREPQGIALDKNRNVYVAGKDTHNIVVLSPDGKNCKQI